MENKPKTKQKMRFSDEELQLIKNTFADNDDLLKVLRKVFLQMDLTTNDMELLRVMILNKPDLLKVLRKNFLPELEQDVPIGQQIDLWLTIGLKDMIPEIAVMHLKSIQIWKDYLEQQFEALDKEEFFLFNKKITLRELSGIKIKDDYKYDTDIYIDMLARNTIINSVEQGLMQLLILAGKKDETVEELKNRLAKDSAK